jgi:L1 cell adhesion molecule like protein
MSNKHAVRRLCTACECAKCTLSSATEASIEIDSLFESINFCTSITQPRFEELNAEQVEKCLRDSKLDKAQIHDIVLVGGSMCIPKVQKLLQDFFSGKEMKQPVDPDEAVASGAALYAAVMAKYTYNFKRIMNMCFNFEK